VNALSTPRTFGPYRAEIVREHDGDTVTVNVLLRQSHYKGAEIDLGFNVWRSHRGIELRNQNVRIYGIDAPELITVEGQIALAFLQNVLPIGSSTILTSHGWDKYGGRIDGQITLRDGRDLAGLMIEKGMAKPWSGKGPKP